jgi:transketolase
VESIDLLSINTLRFLALDMVNAAQSGHPGTPMGIAPVAYTLWTRFLRHAPTRPDWPDRDRFILSNGHASSLLYSLLHLTGYNLPLDELRRFRQLGSHTPGHPERRRSPGTEMTSGALGQGFATAVGMALAEAHLAAEFNRPGLPPLIDHTTYVLCSDGDMMEGVSAEAASLAGHLRLGKLIALYDDNQVTIEGSTNLAFSEDVLGRFASYGWHTLQVTDGNDLEAVEQAIRQAKAERDRPSILRIRTVIGYGNPRQGTGAAHFGHLNAAEMAATRQALEWAYTEPFTIPAEVRDHFAGAVEKGAALQSEWQGRLDVYRESYPDEVAELERRLKGELPEGWEQHLPVFASNPAGEATRFANGPIVNALAGVLPELIGGAADLAPNTQTLIKNQADLTAQNYSGRNLHFGVREHAMAAITNGLALHGGLRPYAATFLIFSDYLRPALRIGALSGAASIFIFSNDSIGVGEDGPTHQPVEHLVSLRAMPGVTLLRPCDSNEVAEAWKFALHNRQGPTCIALTRQPVPVLDRSQYASAAGLQRGGYILSEAPGGVPQALIIATGSEVQLALQAQQMLHKQGVQARVVSLPGWSVFECQPAEYRAAVLPPQIKVRLAVEAGSSIGWERWVGEAGKVIALDGFGVSGPWKEVFIAFGITAEAVAAAVLEMLSA